MSKPEPLTKKERENFLIGMTHWKNGARPPREDRPHYPMVRRYEATIVALEKELGERLRVNQR